MDVERHDKVGGKVARALTRRLAGLARQVRGALEVVACRPLSRL